MAALLGRRHRATALCRVAMSLERFEGQTRPPALAGWALPQVYIATICAVSLSAGITVQDIDGLTVVRPWQTGGANVLLLVPVDEADLRGALVDSGHGFAR